MRQSVEFWLSRGRRLGFYSGAVHEPHSAPLSACPVMALAKVEVEAPRLAPAFALVALAPARAKLVVSLGEGMGEALGTAVLAPPGRASPPDRNTPGTPSGAGRIAAPDPAALVELHGDARAMRLQLLSREAVYQLSKPIKCTSKTLSQNSFRIDLTRHNISAIIPVC
jgi:hypothetical protein